MQTSGILDNVIGKFAAGLNNLLPRVLVLFISDEIRGNEQESSIKEMSLIKKNLLQVCKTDPRLHDLCSNEKLSCVNNELCILPQNKHNLNVVLYYVHDYEPLLESCNVSPSVWKRLVQDIQDNYEDFEGFVVVHGTDTLAYTASALSFMFERLSKPIVLTGGSTSIFDPRSNARENLAYAIMIAGNFDIPELTIFFTDRLIRGNRSIRSVVEGNLKFESPNVKPHWEISDKVQENLKRSSKTHCRPVVRTRLIPCVSILYMFPGIPLQVVKASLSSPIRGVVLVSYGSGQIPTDREDVLEAIEEAVINGILIVNCTQSTLGSASAKHLAGSLLTDIGVISGRDMTIEAAVTKLMYVLGKKSLNSDGMDKLMNTSIRGEMTQE